MVERRRQRGRVPLPSVPCWENPRADSHRRRSSMLRVLRHYLPIRKALLILSETVLLTLVLAAWTTAHLWQPSADVSSLLGRMTPSLVREGAIWRCVLS